MTVVLSIEEQECFCGAGVKSALVHKAKCILADA